MFYVEYLRLPRTESFFKAFITAMFLNIFLSFVSGMFCHGSFSEADL